MTANQMVGPEAMRALLLNNEGSWDTPEIVTAIEAFFVTLRDAGCFPEDPNAIGYDDGNPLFFNGEALLHTTGSWLVAEIVEAQMPDYEVGFVPFPEIEGGKGRVWISGVGSAWYISANSAAPRRGRGLHRLPLLRRRQSRSGSANHRYFVPVDFDLSTIESGPADQR